MNPLQHVGELVGSASTEFVRGDDTEPHIIVQDMPDTITAGDILDGVAMKQANAYKAYFDSPQLRETSFADIVANTPIMDMSRLLPAPADPFPYYPSAVTSYRNSSANRSRHSREFLPAYDSSYLEKVLTTPLKWRETLDKAIAKIESAGIEADFQAFLFIGNSGALLAPALAAHFNKQLILVRKENDNSHSSRLIEGVSVACDYMFVDDLISSGATLRYVMQQMHQHRPGARLRAVYTYNADWLVANDPGAYIIEGVRLEQ